MSTPATVPIFDPSGTLRDVPYEHMKDAVSSGGVPAVRFQDPQGNTRFVPSNRTAEAVQAGGKLLRIEQQDIQHPGFWMSLGSDLGGMAKGLWHGAADPLTDTHEDLVNKLHAEQASDQVAENSPERKAHGAVYRNVTVPAAEAVGVNVPGMEQSAAEGDVAGVAGHAAAPVAAAAITSGLLKGAGAVGEAADAAASSPTLRAGLKAAAKKLPVAAIRRIPYVGDVAADVYHAGTDAAANAKGAPTSELDATEAPDYERYAPNTSAEASTETPTPEVETPAETPAANPEPAAPKRTIVTDPATGRPEFSDVVAAKQQAAARPVAAAVPPPQAAAVPTAAATATAAAPATAADDLLGRLGKVADRIQKQEAAAPGMVDEDLLQQAQDSLDIIRAKKAVQTTQAPVAQPESLDQFNQRLSGIADRRAAAAASPIPEQIPQGGVHTTAAPGDLTKRWGVTGNSVADTDANLRGMNLKESQAYVNKLAESYKNGKPVEPVLETRDANNNIVDVDGRHRALAAHKAGIERIPIIVRRLGVSASTPAELVARPE